jgi:hypothetical protein
MIHCLVMYGNIRNMKDEKCSVGKKLVKNMKRKQTSILVILFVVRGETEERINLPRKK